MPPRVVVFAITGHGFGHASRVIEVINALLAREPGVVVHVRTAAPRWLFDLTVRGPYTCHHVETDTGVVQIDSLHPDIPRTVETAAAFYDTLGARAGAEASFLRDVGAQLVVADLPPLAIAAAALANVPAAALGNFTWDWIYEGYAPWLGPASWLPAALRDAQATALEAWRLPMHGGFAAYRRIVDVPFVARHAQAPRERVRQVLALPQDAPVVLVSFGGFGLEGLPLDDIASRGRYAVVTAAVAGQRPARAGAGVSCRTRGGGVLVDEHAWYDAGFRYEDLVRACDVVVTKPGYGIIAETIANGVAMLYTSRGEFAEADVLVREMPRYLRRRFIDHPDLLAGRWEPYLDALLVQAPPPERPRTDGAGVVSERILALLA